jgi:hypothetical protein
MACTKVKTKSLPFNRSSRRLGRRASLVATFVAGAALALTSPVFAQAGGASAAETPADNWESSVSPNQAESEDTGAPSFDVPWDDGPVMSPAPERPMESERGSMFVAPPPVGLIEPWEHPAISPTSPTLIPPDSMGRPVAGFPGPVR